MEKVFGYKQLEARQTFIVSGNDVINSGANGVQNKYYKPLYDRLEYYHETATIYNQKKNIFLKSMTSEKKEKAEIAYKSMNRAKINLIKAHSFQMTEEEANQAQKTIDRLISYEFCSYVREWQKPARDGGGWVKETVYP